MPGIQIFKTLAEAQARGFEILERTHDGWLVRKRTATGYALALVRQHQAA